MAIVRGKKLKAYKYPLTFPNDGQLSFASPQFSFHSYSYPHRLFHPMPCTSLQNVIQLKKSKPCVSLTNHPHSFLQRLHFHLITPSFARLKAQTWPHGILEILISRLIYTRCLRAVESAIISVSSDLGDRLSPKFKIPQNPEDNNYVVCVNPSVPLLNLKFPKVKGGLKHCG